MRAAGCAVISCAPLSWDTDGRWRLEWRFRNGIFVRSRDLSRSPGSMGFSSVLAVGWWASVESVRSYSSNYRRTFSRALRVCAWAECALLSGSGDEMADTSERVRPCWYRNGMRQSGVPLPCRDACFVRPSSGCRTDAGGRGGCGICCGGQTAWLRRWLLRTSSSCLMGVTGRTADELYTEVYAKWRRNLRSACYFHLRRWMYFRIIRREWVVCRKCVCVCMIGQSLIEKVETCLSRNLSYN
jgi:hypothetical protein